MRLSRLHGARVAIFYEIPGILRFSRTRLNDDLTDVACVGYFTVPSFSSARHKLTLLVACRGPELRPHGPISKARSARTVCALLNWPTLSGAIQEPEFGTTFGLEIFGARPLKLRVLFRSARELWSNASYQLHDHLFRGARQPSDGPLPHGHGALLLYYASL